MAFKRKYSRFNKSKKSRRGKFSRRRGRASFQSRVKKVIMKTAETKYYDIGIENVNLEHNTGPTELLFPGYLRSIPQWFNPWSVIQKGTGRMDRVGDKITPRGMSIKLWIANKSDRPNVMYRIIVAVIPKVVNATVTIPRFDPFQIPNSGSLGNYMVMPADTDKGVKFLYDRIFNLQVGLSGLLNTAGGKEVHMYKKLWIKRKRSRDIMFQTVTQEIVNKPLAVYVIPYDSYGTPNLDTVGSVAGFMRMYYKDV